MDSKFLSSGVHSYMEKIQSKNISQQLPDIDYHILYVGVIVLVIWLNIIRHGKRKMILFLFYFMMELAYNILINDILHFIPLFV